VAINEQAPVVGRGEIEIAAAPELVWDVLTAIDRWPSWNPQVKSMDMQGGLAEERSSDGRPGPERSLRPSGASRPHG